MRYTSEQMRRNFEKENSRDGKKELGMADSNYFN